MAYCLRRYPALYNPHIYRDKSDFGRNRSREFPSMTWSLSSPRYSIIAWQGYRVSVRTRTELKPTRKRITDCQGLVATRKRLQRGNPGKKFPRCYFAALLPFFAAAGAFFSSHEVTHAAREGWNVFDRKHFLCDEVRLL